MNNQDFMSLVKQWRCGTEVFWKFSELSYLQLLTLNMSDKHIFGWKAKGNICRAIRLKKKSIPKSQRMGIQQTAEQMFKNIKLMSAVQ